jgi:ketosteroid isomerase-like protein
MRRDARRDRPAVVDAFQAALRAGDIERAAGYLDPGVVILESGGAEHSRDEYLAVHAQADAQFLKSVKVTPGRRTARIEGDFAWVASLSEFEVEKEGQVAFIDSAETMVLRRDAAGWKIVHIHWSSHE